MIVAANLTFRTPGRSRRDALALSGTVLFQGNLYLIALGNIRTFQMLTPVGGIFLMLGWLVLAIQALWITLK